MVLRSKEEDEGVRKREREKKRNKSRNRIPLSSWMRRERGRERERQEFKEEEDADKFKGKKTDGFFFSLFSLLLIRDSREDWFHLSLTLLIPIPLGFPFMDSLAFIPRLMWRNIYTQENDVWKEARDDEERSERREKHPSFLLLVLLSDQIVDVVVVINFL